MKFSRHFNKEWRKYGMDNKKKKLNNLYHLSRIKGKFVNAVVINKFKKSFTIKKSFTFWQDFSKLTLILLKIKRIKIQISQASIQN